MRVCIINLNLVAQDAIGQNILQQVRFFRRRGDEVQIYLQYPPLGVSDDIVAACRVVDISTLRTNREPFFTTADLFVFHYGGYYELIDSIRYLERGAVSFHYHNVTPPALWNREEDRQQMEMSVASVGKLASYADLVVADSEFNAKDLIEQHGCDPERIRVIPLAVPLEQFFQGPADPKLRSLYQLHNHRVLLYVGRVASNKRVDLLVEALALVKKQIPNALLLIAGDHSTNPAFVPVVEQIRQLSRQLQVEKDVIFTGRVEQIAPIYRLAEVYVTASLHEGFAVPLIEAMASGVPVVASDCAAHPGTLGNAGLLVQPEDPAAMAEKVVQILSDDVLYGQLVQRGIERATDFTVEASNIQFSQVIAEVTAGLPKRPFPFARLKSLDELNGVNQAKLAAHPTTVQPEIVNSDAFITLSEDIDQLKNAANVIIRNYTVHSGFPLIGGVIAWVRRNLTSHLREPYLDPMMRRQETFNWQVILTLRHLLADLHKQLGANPNKIVELEQEIAGLRSEMEALQRELREYTNKNSDVS